MRFLLVCLLAAFVAFCQSWSGPAEEADVKKGNGFEKLLTTYLQNRLERARLSLKQLQQLEETGMTAVLDLWVAEDEIDRCRLHLRLATEGRLIADHPALTELRRELGVPEVPELPDAGKREAVSAAIQEYLQKKLVRAERVTDRALSLYDLRRGTESEVLAAKSNVEGLKLLLELERLSVREAKK